MIVGIGADLLQLKRLEAAYERTQGRLAKRVLGDEELIVFEQRLKRNHKRGIAYLATRFAAKEAFSKALGTGLRAPATFQNIAVCHDVLGKPMLLLAPELQAFLDTKNIKQTHISISDEKTLAAAFVVLET